MEQHILSTRFGIDEENLDALAEDAKDYAFSKGIAMRASDLPLDARVPLSFCIVPSSFPEKFFQFVYDLQPCINLILHQISFSKEILKKCLSSTIEVDEFTRNIFKIYEEVDQEISEQQLSLGLIRSDYMLNTDSSQKITGIKQVENNTIASSFGGLAPSIRDLHEFVLEKLGQKSFEHRLPVNESVYELAKGIISAWDTYENQSAIVLFVVEETTLNICDQRALEYAILDFESRISVLRCTFKELRNTAKLKGKKLLVKDKEVAVVYYRTGYIPEHYEPEDWEVRLLMERSIAIKCPSVGLHLAGTKKVQLYLTKPGVLENFVSNDVAEKLREVFVQQYALDMGSDGDKIISMGIQNPDKYVMKPEREGGGNNIYGDDVKHLLEDIRSTERRKAYILMERIKPPGIPNCIIQRDKVPETSNIVCELGIFGVILGNKKDVFINNAAGHLLRSKKMDSNEGGIAAGFGALDSPYLE